MYQVRPTNGFNMHVHVLFHRNPQATSMRKKRGQNFVVEFSIENIVVCATNPSGDSLMIQLYVSLPGGASKPDNAATAHVLPLATLEEVFTENGDIISGYTLSSSLASAVSDGSRWKDLFLTIGGGAVITLGVILTLVLCLGLVAYRWNKKKRQVPASSLVRLIVC